MSQINRYTSKVIALSAIFIPINIAALLFLQEEITWWKISVIIGVLAVADIVFILVGRRKETVQPHAKHTPKSTD